MLLWFGVQWSQVVPVCDPAVPGRLAAEGPSQLCLAINWLFPDPQSAADVGKRVLVSLPYPAASALGLVAPAQWGTGTLGSPVAHGRVGTLCLPCPGAPHCLGTPLSAPPKGGLWLRVGRGLGRAPHPRQGGSREQSIAPLLQLGGVNVLQPEQLSEYFFLSYAIFCCVFFFFLLWLEKY